MKKLSIFILLILFFNMSFGQDDPLVTWDGLKKQKEKTDQEILDDKKNKSYKIWAKRADIYLNIHTFVTAGLYQGMPATGDGFNTIEFIYKKPGKKLTTETYEIWIYNQKKLFIKDNKLDKWEQTEFIDKDAIQKSSEAYLKAVELDDKNKFKDKSSSKDLLLMIKKNVINDGVLNYQNKKFSKSYELMSYGYKLLDLPKHEVDSIYDKDQVGYYLGIIAFNCKKYDDANTLFQTSIKKDYSPGMSYHYIAECNAASGDSAAFISTIKEGFEKYPEEEQLIIDLINYYLIRKQTKDAIEYIDVAISKNPTNPSYYSAKATIYDNKTKDLMEEYKKYMEDAYEFKKEAFRDRNNPKKLKTAQNKRDGALNQALETVKIIEDNLKIAEDLYNKSLEIDSKFFNAAYNLGRLYLKKNERNALHADYLLKIFIKKDFNKSSEFEELAKSQLKTAADKFEVSHEILPKDTDVLQVLKRIYFRLRDKENQERIDAKLKELGGNEEEIIIE